MLRSIVLATAALIAAPAAAQGFYVGAHFGQATYRGSCDGVSSCDDSDTAWRILGGFQFNQNLAVEAAYTDLGAISGRDNTAFGAGTATATATATEVVAVGMLPLANRFGIYGKVGMYRGEVDTHVRQPGLGSDSESESNTGLTFGGGASFALTQSFALRGEWQRYRAVGGEETGEDDIDVLSVGVLFRF
jgi:OmpA-OmpF porin, OOP family